MKEFETAKMDDLTRIITVAVVLLVLAVPLLPGREQVTFPIRGLLLAFGLGICIFSYLHVPQNFTVSNEMLTFKNALRTHTIPLSSIITAERTKNKLHLRAFGIGGLFGYFGRYNANERWFVTNRFRKVKLETESGTFVISPEEPEEFLAYINRLIK